MPDVYLARQTGGPALRAQRCACGDEQVRRDVRVETRIRARASMGDRHGFRDCLCRVAAGWRATGVSAARLLLRSPCSRAGGA